MTALDPVDTIPLTARQRILLTVDCIPPVFFATMLLLYVTVLQDVLGGIKPALVLFLAAVILFTGYDSLKSVRDLRSGVALVREDVLQRVGRSRRTRGRRYAVLAQLGKLWIRGSGVAESHATNRCRVTYSPASRSAWSFAPLNQ